MQSCSSLTPPRIHFDLLAGLTSGGRFLAPGPSLTFVLYAQVCCWSSASFGPSPLRAHFAASVVHLYTEEKYELEDGTGLCLDR